MKSCVVFAVSIFDVNRLYVLRDFLESFRNKFSDCDFYIGINYGSIPEVEDVINEYKLNARVTRLTNESLYCGSDASAYQVALKDLRDSNKSYDLYWFAHTKGAVNNRPAERQMYLSELFGNRTAIESMFETHDYLGSYALRGVSRSAASYRWDTFNNDHHIDICSNFKFDILQYSHVNWSYIETMYVIKGDAIQAFLRNSPNEFYTNKLQDHCYFEITFPWIVSRCGYYPYIKESACFFGEANLKDITKEWIYENNLQTKLKYYLDL